MTFARRAVSVVPALLLTCGLAASFVSTAKAEPAEMVLGIAGQLPLSTRSAIPGTIPTSGTVGSAADPRFTNFGQRMFRSPTSNQWITVATTNQTPATADQVLIIGSGRSIPSGQVAAREGVTQSTIGDLMNFGGLSYPRLNDSGQWAVSYQPNGGTALTQRVLKWDGVSLTTAFQPGDVLGALGGATVQGSFQFGAAPFNSASISNSGSVSFLAATTAGTAMFGANGNVALITLNVDIPTSQAAGGAATWTALTAFSQSADAVHSLALGKVGLDTTQDVVVAIDGDVKIQKGSILAGSGFTSAVSVVSDAYMESNGDWFARGGNADSTFWLVRNGVVIATSGASVTPGSSEHWKTGTTTPFIDVHGNNAGNWVIVGTTDNTTTTLAAVMVLNGVRVIARSSDPVDVGDGLTPANSLFLHTPFQANGVFNNDGFYYFFSRLKATAAGTTGTGTSPNNASMIRVYACPADFNGSGSLGVQDIFDFLAAWFAGDVRADYNRNAVINVQDIFDFLSGWFTGC